MVVIQALTSLFMYVHAASNGLGTLSSSLGTIISPQKVVWFPNETK